MRSILSAVVIVAVLASTAHAQPGQPQPGPYPPPPVQPAPYPPAQQPPPPMQQPPPGVPPPYGYAPMQLTPEEHELLLDGEIGEGAHIAGVVANFFIGFGIGQAIQGRFGDTGWIFALGEAASFTVFIIGIGQLARDCGIVERDDCDESNGAGLALAGALGLGVFHVWGLVDSIAGPSRHNRRVRDLRMRVGQPMYSHRIQPFLHKSRDGGGFAGMALRF
jgi:hypothetical protein